MKLISCHDGKLHTLDASVAVAAAAGRARPSSHGNAFRTGLPALDDLPPGGAFARAAVHEVLHQAGEPVPMFPAALLARCAMERGDEGRPDQETRRPADKGRKDDGGHPFSLSPCPLVPSPSFTGAIVWSDPTRELYPPALAALGIPLEQLFLLHPASEAEEVWALTECLRCRGVTAVVAALRGRGRQRRGRGAGGLSRVEARRLQLAAEHGGGVGLLLRPAGGASAEHAAVTRWLVRPEPGERNVQCWRIQLIFGHGGQVGQSIILEHHRGRDDASQSQQHPQQHHGPLRPRVTARPVRPAAELADRPAAPRAGAAWAPAAGRATA